MYLPVAENPSVHEFAARNTEFSGRRSVWLMLIASWSKLHSLMIFFQAVIPAEAGIYVFVAKFPIFTSLRANTVTLFLSIQMDKALHDDLIG